MPPLPASGAFPVRSASVSDSQGWSPAPSSPLGARIPALANPAQGLAAPGQGSVPEAWSWRRSPLAAPAQHWVISDVHGCADALQLLVSRLPAADRIVLCGDVINRGPRIEAAMDLAWDLVISGRAVWLMGNHEKRLVDLLHSGVDWAWNDLARCATFRQLGAQRCRLWLERLEHLPLTYGAAGWVATHAGFDPRTWLPDLHVRMPFWQAYDGRFGEVVVGHTPGPEVRRLQGGITLIDTGACYGGPLTAYCPETGAIEQVPGLITLSSPRQDLALA